MRLLRGEGHVNRAAALRGLERIRPDDADGLPDPSHPRSAGSAHRGHDGGYGRGGDAHRAPGVDPGYIAATDRSALRFEKLQSALGEGPCLAAYDTGAAVAVPDLRGDGRFPRFAPRAVEAGLGAVFTFPLRHGDRQLGSSTCTGTPPGPLTRQTMTAAQTLADVAAAHLINAQARDELQDSSERSY